jgi:hypothetical protein
MEQNLQTFENWNELEYSKYRFYAESIWLDKKEVCVVIYLEIDYISREPSFTIHTRIIIKNHGEVPFGEEKEIELNNLFRMEKISDLHLYLLPYEEKMINIALAYAKNKIKQYYDAEGENL